MKTKKVQKISLSKNWLIVSFCIFTTIFHNLAFWQNLFTKLKLLSISSLKILIVVFVLNILVNFILFSLFSFSKKSLKFSFLVISAIHSVAHYYIRTYNVDLDYSMFVSVFATDRREVGNLLHIKLFIEVILFSILPSLIIFKFVKVVNKRSKFKFLKYWISYFLIIFITSIVLVFANYRQVATFFRAEKTFFYKNVPMNYIFASIKYVKKSMKKTTHHIFSIDEHAKVISTNNKKKLLVIVLGEAARAKNFSIYNYSRETNPNLKKEDILAFKNTISCATCTADSLPCMFSHLGREDHNASKVSYESFVTFARNLGIKTAWYDNNFGGAKKIVPMEQEQSLVSSQNKKFCSTGECFDEILLSDVQNFINKNNNHDMMIILHQNGSHGPFYYKRYPKEFEKFTPVCKTNQIVSCSKEELINAYDNTILYTDHVISKVIDLLKKNKGFQSSMIYMSDHGQSLGEYGMYLHGAPYFIAPREQKEIPFIIWLSEETKREKKINYQCLKKMINNDKLNYSHDNLFHSVMGIMDIKTDKYKKDLDVLRKCN